MAVEKAKAWLRAKGMEDRLVELASSSATVELAAQAIGCEPGRIAKTLSFLTPDGPILIVAAGDVKVDNRKYKAVYGVKASMIRGDEVEGYIGHAPGGVCPFGVNGGVRVYLDESLRKYDPVYPAGGSSNSMVRLSLAELESVVDSLGWVDVCRPK